MGPAIVIGIIALACAFPPLVASRRALWSPASACAALAAVFLLLFAFVHPAADDWWLAAVVRDQGWRQAQITVYHQLNGRILPTALLSLIMLADGPVGYRLASLLMLVGLACSLASLLRALWPSQLSWPQALLGGGAALCVIISLLPSPVEGIYWLPGVLCYPFALSLGIAAIALLWRCESRCDGSGDGSGERQGGSGHRSLPGMLLACAIGFAAACCSETSTALIAVAVAMIGLDRWRSDRNRAWPWLGLLLALLAGAGVLAASPGNAHRLQEVATPLRPWPPLIASLALAPLRTFTWLIDQPLAWFAGAFAACWGYAQVRSRPSLRALILGGYLAIALAVAPACIIIGFLPPRASDVVTAAAILWWLLAASSFGSWLGEDEGRQLRLSSLVRWLPVLVLWPLWVLVAPASGDEDRLVAGCACLLVGLAILRRRRLAAWSASASWPRWLRGAAAGGMAATLLLLGSFPHALADLLWRAPERNRELSRREAWLTTYGPELRRAGGVVKVPMPDSRTFPSTISTGDLTCAPQAWVNQAYALRFGVAAIQADPRLPDSMLDHPPVR